MFEPMDVAREYLSDPDDLELSSWLCVEGYCDVYDVAFPEAVERCVQQLQVEAVVDDWYRI